MTESDGEIREKRQLFAAGKVLESILSSTGPADLCRQIVHSSFVPNSTRGCELFYLDNKSVLRSIASYGLSVAQSKDLSAWDDSPLSKAIREKRLLSGSALSDGKELTVIAMPFVSNGVPIGLAAVVLEDKDYKISISEDMANLFLKLGAFYIESLDFGNVSNGAGLTAVNPEDLTTRQMIILGHIQNGLVNLEIAKILMLSESTIRQETVRIYRALGAGNRQEAVKKARALGLLPKKSAPFEK